MTSVSELQAWINTSLSSKWGWICLWAWSIAAIMLVGIAAIISVLAAVLMMWQGMSNQANLMAMQSEKWHAEAMKEVATVRQEIHQTQKVIVEHREGIWESQFRKLQESKEQP